MNIKIIGKIDEILELEYVGKNNLKKRRVILKEDASYKHNGITVEKTNDFEISFLKNNTEIINDFNIGETVEVDCNLEGKKFNKTNMPKPLYFNSITGWKISKHVFDTEQVEELTPFPELDNINTNTKAQFPEKETDSPF